MTGAAVQAPLRLLVALHQIHVVGDVPGQHHFLVHLVDIGASALVEARDYASPSHSFPTCKGRVHEGAVAVLHATQQIVVDAVPTENVRPEHG